MRITLRRKAAVILFALMTGGSIAFGAQQPGSGNDPELIKAAVNRLQSADLEERCAAIMRLRRRDVPADAIPALIRLLGSRIEFPWKLLIISSEIPITRSCDNQRTLGGEAAETLARIGRPFDELLPLLNSTDWSVRADAARALGGLKDIRSLEKLISLLSDTDERWQVRGNAALALGLIQDQRAAQPLLTALRDTSSQVRASAAMALGSVRAPGSLEMLIGALEDPESDVRRASVGSIGQIGGAEAVAPLIRAALHDQEQIVREVATNWLAWIKDDRVAGALMAALADPYINVRIAAARGLGEHRSATAAIPLIRMLSDESSASRLAAADALGKLGDNRAIPALIRMVLQEEDYDWRVSVESGLQALARLGHHQAAEIYKQLRSGAPDKEWWDQNKGLLDVD